MIILKVHIYSYYYAPGNLLSTLHILIHLIFMTKLCQISLPALKWYMCSYKTSNPAKSRTNHKRVCREIMLAKTIENLCNFATTAIPEIKIVLIKILDRYISASLCTQHQSIAHSFRNGACSFKAQSFEGIHF